MVYTSTNILDSIKRNQTIDTSGFRFSDDDLLAMADEEIESTIVPTILRLHSDRLIYRTFVPLVASQAGYDIPYRAIGGQLRDLILQDSTTAPTFKQNLNYYEFENGNLNIQQGSPVGFYFGENDQIILVPSIDAGVQTNYLCFSYHMQHPKLVSSSDVAVISSVDYNTGIITIAATAPSTWSSSSYLDFILANDRSKPRLLSFDKNPTSVASLSITFNVADIPEGLVAGDKIALAQQTDTLLLPNECFKYLCKAVEIKIMEAQKDLKAVEAAQSKLIESRKNMESILTPRITGEPRVILNSNGLVNRNVRRRIGINVTP